MRLLGITLYITLLLFVLLWAGLSYYEVLQRNLYLEKLSYSRETENIILKIQLERWRRDCK